MRKLRKMPLYLAGIAMICIVALVWSITAGQMTVRTHYQAKTNVQTPKPYRVMVIGGSVAHGWDDKVGGGYLRRAFDHYPTYQYIDKTIVGANSTQLQETLYKGDYETWLKEYRPNVVVISWGLLNDCLPDTPKANFDKYLRVEITQALASHAMVYVVSPPVTIASYTKYLVRQQRYVNDELHVVRQIKSPNLYFFNVFDQMKAYLRNHHLSVYDFGTNTWHPDAEGHIIAARLLLADMQGSHSIK